MKILIAGGSGFLGRALTKSFLGDGHQVYILTRGSRVPAGAQAVQWDGKTADGWGHLLNQMDVVIHLAGKSLASWPWTRSTKRVFETSRLEPGRALVQAIQAADSRPGIFLQQSGINYYGLRGPLADEDTPPADDFPAQLAVKWEDSSKPLDDLGVRRIITRTSPVLASDALLLKLMALPVQLFLGGKIGNGTQSTPWIHIADWIAAVRHLIAQPDARGPYNLIAPEETSNAQFMQTLATVLNRPYWFHVPEFLLRIFLGEMSVMITQGRFSRPKRLIQSGYVFQFPAAKEAFLDLYKRTQVAT